MQYTNYNRTGRNMLLALAPGPDNLGVLALGISRGRRETLGFAVGCAAGCLNHTLLAVLGISALIAASPAAFRQQRARCDRGSAYPEAQARSGPFREEDSRGTRLMHWSGHPLPT